MKVIPEFFQKFALFFKQNVELIQNRPLRNIVRLYLRFLGLFVLLFLIVECSTNVVKLLQTKDSFFAYTAMYHAPKEEKDSYQDYVQKAVAFWVWKKKAGPNLGAQSTAQSREIVLTKKKKAGPNPGAQSTAQSGEIVLTKMLTEVEKFLQEKIKRDNSKLRLQNKKNEPNKPKKPKPTKPRTTSQQGTSLPARKPPPNRTNDNATSQPSRSKSSNPPPNQDNKNKSASTKNKHLTLNEIDENPATKALVTAKIKHDQSVAKVKALQFLCSPSFTRSQTSPKLGSYCNHWNRFLAGILHLIRQRINPIFQQINDVAWVILTWLTIVLLIVVWLYFYFASPSPIFLNGKQIRENDPAFSIEKAEEVKKPHVILQLRGIYTPYDGQVNVPSAWLRNQDGELVHLQPDPNAPPTPDALASSKLLGSLVAQGTYEYSLHLPEPKLYQIEITIERGFLPIRYKLFVKYNPSEMGESLWRLDEVTINQQKVIEFALLSGELLRQKADCYVVATNDRLCLGLTSSDTQLDRLRAALAGKHIWTSHTQCWNPDEYQSCHDVKAFSQEIARQFDPDEDGSYANKRSYIAEYKQGYQEIIFVPMRKSDSPEQEHRILDHLVGKQVCFVASAQIIDSIAACYLEIQPLVGCIRTAAKQGIEAAKKRDTKLHEDDQNWIIDYIKVRGEWLKENSDIDIYFDYVRHTWWYKQTNTLDLLAEWTSWTRTEQFYFQQWLEWKKKSKTDNTKQQNQEFSQWKQEEIAQIKKATDVTHEEAEKRWQDPCIETTREQFNLHQWENKEARKRIELEIWLKHWEQKRLNNPRLSPPTEPPYVPPTQQNYVKQTILHALLAFNKQLEEHLVGSLDKELRALRQEKVAKEAELRQLQENATVPPSQTVGESAPLPSDVPSGEPDATPPPTEEPPAQNVTDLPQQELTKLEKQIQGKEEERKKIINQWWRCDAAGVPFQASESEDLTYQTGTIAIPIIGAGRVKGDRIECLKQQLNACKEFFEWAKKPTNQDRLWIKKILFVMKVRDNDNFSHAFNKALINEKLETEWNSLRQTMVGVSLSPPDDSPFQ